MSNATDNCSVMESIATFTPLRILLSFFIIVSITAIPLILNVIRRIVQNPLYHLNTKVVLVAHAIGLIVHHSDRLVFHGWDLYRYLIILPSAPSACDIISSSERCFGLRIAFNCAMWFCVSTTPALVLERYLATRRTMTYQSDKHSWAPVMLFQCLLASVLLGFVYAKQSFGGTTFYCMAASSSLPLHVLSALALTIVVQLMSIGFYRYLVGRNENLRQSLQKSGGHLIIRYQVEESLRALGILSLPVHLMFLFQFAYSFVSFFVLYFNSYFSRPVYYLLMEGNIYLPEYSIVFVYTFIKMEKKYNDSSSKGLRKSIEIDTVEYFKNYKRDWS